MESYSLEPEFTTNDQFNVKQEIKNEEYANEQFLCYLLLNPNSS